MKRSVFSIAVLGLVLALAATGCKHTGVGVTPLPGKGNNAKNIYGEGTPGGGDHGNPVPSEPPPNSTPFSTTTAAEPISQPTGDWEKLPHDASVLAEQTVHFDFDSATIKSSENAKLQAVAEYLKSNSTKWLEIHGHCDERGTEGYNLSLGERRALAAREALIGMGISADRMKTISFGEARPVAQGHDESAFRQNRRDEFVVVTPQ